MIRKSGNLILIFILALCLSITRATLLVFRGETAQLPCETDQAVLTIEWKFGSDPTSPSSRTVASFVNGNYVGSDGGRITMSHDRGLAINNVVVEDEGAYHCVVQTSAGGTVVLSSDLVVAVPPQEPYPSLSLISPPGTVTNASCNHIIEETMEVSLRCVVASFRPTIQLEWRRDNQSVVESSLIYVNNTGGLRNAYSNYEFTMGTAVIEVGCLATGEAVHDADEPKVMTAVICPTPFTGGGGGASVATIVIIIVIVLIFVVVVVVIVFWIRKLVQDTMVRSAYTKTVSADDDTPSRGRFSNYCHFCRLTVCPCLMRDELYDVESSKKTSHSKDEPDRRPKAPSAALKARIQQNRKKQEGKPQGEADHETGHEENSPMIDERAQTSGYHGNNKPPGARPKKRASDNAEVVVRDPSQIDHQRLEDQGAVGGETETGF